MRRLARGKAVEMDWLVIAVGLGGALCVVLAFGLGRWLERRAET